MKHILYLKIKNKKFFDRDFFFMVNNSPTFCRLLPKWGAIRPPRRSWGSRYHEKSWKIEIFSKKCSENDQCSAHLGTPDVVLSDYLILWRHNLDQKKVFGWKIYFYHAEFFFEVGKILKILKIKTLFKKSEKSKKSKMLKTVETFRF